MLRQFDGVDGLDAWLTYIPDGDYYYRCLNCSNIQTYGVAIDLEYELCNNCRQERGYLPKS